MHEVSPARSLRLDSFEETLSSRPGPRTDARYLRSGATLWDRNGYCDGANIVAVGGRGGRPLVLSVVLHHCESREGGAGLRIYGTRSHDGGRTWLPALPIEESLSRQSHDGYQLVHVRPDGTERIYLFYGYNDGALHHAGPGSGGEVELPRSDMQLREGYFLRYSDDAGATWSSERYTIPVRRTRIDRDNPWAGEIMGMFMCDKPQVIDDAVYFAFQKTPDGAGETAGSEVFFLRSRNLLMVENPAQATWETLPDGEAGLQSPAGELRLGEEPHIQVVEPEQPERLFTLWRSDAGYVAASYSSDAGASWDSPFWLTYEGLPEGAGGLQKLKNPRGALTPHRLASLAVDGRSEFALLFYNNGRTERFGYCGREVYWLTVGRSTAGGVIQWAQPEIALWWDGVGLAERGDWNPDWAIVDGPGYPDFVEIEEKGLCFIESDKLSVRFHEIEARLLAFLRAQPELAGVPALGKVVDESSAGGLDTKRLHTTPILPDLRSGGGFSVCVEVRGSPPEVRAGQTLLSAMRTVTANRDEEPTGETITKGYELRIVTDGELELYVTDGFDCSFRQRTSAGGWEALWDGQAHVVSFLLDGGPKVASVVVDERLNDGGEGLAQGWSFLPREMGEIGGGEVRFSPEFGGRLSRFLLYDRALLTTEAIALSRSLRGGGLPS